MDGTTLALANDRPPGPVADLRRPPAAPPDSRVEMTISPKFPHKPPCRPAHAHSTPERPGRACLDAPPDAATVGGTSVALWMHFRGSIAWLDGSLSTLQSTASPRHDARLASDCAATRCRVGFAPTGFAVKSFSYVFSSHRVLLSRAYLAQSPFQFPDHHSGRRSRLSESESHRHQCSVREANYRRNAKEEISRGNVDSWAMPPERI